MKQKYKYMFFGFFEGILIFIILPYLFSYNNFGFPFFDFLQIRQSFGLLLEIFLLFLFYAFMSVILFLICFYFSKYIGKNEPFLKSLFLFLFGVFISLVSEFIFLITLFLFSSPTIL